MKLGDLLRETLNVDCDEVWENERTPTPVRVFGVRLHSMGLSLREVVAVFEWVDVDRSRSRTEGMSFSTPVRVGRR